MPPKKDKDKGGDEEKLTRIAIVSADRCKPKKCRQECKKSCPVVKIGAFPRWRAHVPSRRAVSGRALILRPANCRQALCGGVAHFKDRAAF